MLVLSNGAMCDLSGDMAFSTEGGFAGARLVVRCVLEAAEAGGDLRLRTVGNELPSGPFRPAGTLALVRHVLFPPVLLPAPTWLAPSPSFVLSAL
jgi:hypothetical protein